ncbi:PREDICTED: uncharacterized protein LOC107102246 [Cyprinodon variegatus]|uniref:uncharacterized protein LOC107102246 n=1 Tax=Cyprinodon variegatus TaxID=28743 RepID=UPI000742822B|nr:PREDICTED: uncharacterized protein LOC107102246 [Cyprinodon variegatus]
MNKLYWSKTSGLLMITDLQRSDSGIYTIDSKKGKVFYTFYNLTVYDPPPSPAVRFLTVSSEICWLLCSVDNPTSLLWYKDEEILNQSSSAVSLPITVYRNDRDSSYRCVAANPAGNKTFHLDVRTSCGFNETESSDHERYHWTVIPVVIGVLLCAVLLIYLLKWKLPETKTTRQIQDLPAATLSLQTPAPCPSEEVMMRLSAAEEVKKNLIGTIGGNLTFPDPLLEFGFLLKGRIIASINDEKLQTFEEIYMNKLHWSKNSGLFMITDLQRSDSGIYTIDSKKGRVFYTSYNLTVYGDGPNGEWLCIMPSDSARPGLTRKKPSDRRWPMNSNLAWFQVFIKTFKPSSLLEGKELDLLKEVEHYMLEIVRLASTYSLASEFAQPVDVFVHLEKAFNRVPHGVQ